MNYVLYVARFQGQIFNVGYANMRVREIADLVAKTVGDFYETAISIKVQANTDNRSYHINSDKIKRVLGFEPKRTVEDAVRGICERFQRGEMQDSFTNPIYLNIGQYLESGIG